ncbi:MAG: hypothetical protein ACRDDH_20200 [Cetobacterium sp.]|uniref:hypothetical protein n=1 Tax=Cetobacterium sp. TaxID=2071632 RepID=UPI003EE46D80
MNSSPHKIEGIFLCQIISTKYKNVQSYNILQVKAKLYNTTHYGICATFSIFENNAIFNSKSFLNEMNINNEDELLSKLFYARFETNNKGYPELKDFFFQIDEENLIYDPRNQSLKNIFNFKGDYNAK